MIDELTYRTIAGAQHGAIARSQLREAGLDRFATARRIDQGVLQRVTSRCFVVEGSPDTPQRRCWVAILDAGGVVSHESALGLWGLPGFEVEPVEVTRLRGGRTVASHVATIHSPRLLMPHHLTELDGVPLTSPVRSIFDVAGHLHPRRLERALDTAWARGLVNRRVLRRTLFELSKQGRSGIGVMRELLADRDEHYRPPESGLEARFQSVLLDAGITSFQRQVDVGGEDLWLGRSDFRHAVKAVAVFVDSALYHSALIDRRRDERQRAELEIGGWEVVRVTDVDVWHRHREVVAMVAAALARASGRRNVA